MGYERNSSGYKNPPTPLRRVRKACEAVCPHLLSPLLGQNVHLETGEVDLETGEVDLEAGEVDLETGEVDLETGEVDLETGEVDMSFL